MDPTIQFHHRLFHPCPQSFSFMDQLLEPPDTLLPPPDGSHLSFSGPEQGSDFLSLRDLLPDPCHLVFSSHLHSALTFWSLNTLVGSPVASLRLLQLGPGYKLLPTEPEGTKISEHSETRKQNPEKKVISFSCGVKVSRA